MNIKALLAISILLNFGLAVYALRKPGSAVAPPAPTAPAIRETTGVRQREQAAPNAPAQTPPGTVRQFNWESVEAPDYKQYIANLRSIGCPEETIRDIILADVQKLYDQKKKLARGEPKKFEFWKRGTAFFGAMGDSASMAKMKAVDEERNEVLRSLGIEPDFKTAAAQMVNPLESMFDFLPEGKKVQVLKVMTDMQEKMMKSMEGGQPDTPQVIKAQKEMEKTLKELLTPSEALDFDLRMSVTANMMREQTAGFEPTEQEFLKVFQARKAFDDEFSPLAGNNENEADANRRKEAQKQLKEQLKQTLGPERYADYERAQDYNYQQMHKAAKSANLGTPEANQVYEMKKLAEEQALKIRADRNLNAEQRNRTLTAIQEETERSLRGVLGEKGWDQYNRPANVNWLNRIKPRPPAKAPVPGPAPIPTP